MKLFRKKRVKLHKSLPSIPIHVPTDSKSFLVAGLAAAAVFVLGQKYMKKSVIANAAKSYPAQQYFADTNINTIHRRIISAIYHHASNKMQVINNMDRILQTIAMYDDQLNTLLANRQTGQITPQMYRMQLREIIKDITSKLGIAMNPAPYRKNTGPWQNTQMFDQLSKNPYIPQAQKDMMKNQFHNFPFGGYGSQ